jgi:dihydrofolate reductase
MGSLLVTEWMTLDGVFDAETMAEWWAPFESRERQAAIQQTVASAGGFVLGRTTYQMLAPYWSAMKNDEMGVAAKLNAAPKYVVSSTITKGDWNNSTIIKGEVGSELATLKQQTEGDLLIMGSATLVRALATADLVDEYRFLVQPIVLGRGKRVFEEGAGPLRLKLIEARSLALGVVALRYRPAARGA